MGCQKCNANKNIQETNKEKTCTTCQQAKQKMWPIVVVSIVFISFTIYGVMTCIQDLVRLLSK